MSFPYIKKEKICIWIEVKFLHNILSILHGNYPNKYILCPQVSLLALVKVIKYTSFNYRRYWFNMMGKKHVDFVIVDKLSSKPILVIEINGISHKLLKRRKRDNFLKWIFTNIELPFLILDPQESPIHLSKHLKPYL